MVYARFGGADAPDSATVNLQKGLVGWWKMDGNLKNNTPYGGTAAVTGTITPTTDRKGQANSAYSFDGNSYATVGDADAWSPAAITASAWIYPTSSQTGNVVSKNQNNEWRFRINPNNTITFFDEGATNPVTTTQSVPMNAWSLVTVTGDSSGLQIYINGLLSITKNSAYLSQNTTGPLWFGTYSGTTEFFHGSIDDIRIYNRVLNADEAMALYKGYDSQTNLSAGENGLVGWWKLDGNAKDATPYADNGTLSNVTAVADRKGTANSAYAFTGTTPSNIALPNTGPYTKFGTNSFTVSSWIKTTESLNQRCIISTASSSKGWRFGYYGGKPYYLVGDGTNYQEGVIGTATVNDGKWHDLTIVYAYNGTNWSVTSYIDGQNTGSLNLPSTIGAVNNPQANIGTMGGSTNGAVTGSIDDVRVYKRALSPSDIAAQASSYNSQINLNSTPTSSQSSGNVNSGLIGYWPFNGNAKDATPYQNNGIVNGALPTADRQGRANSAYLLGSTNQWINVGSPSTYNILPNAFTYSVWLNWSGTNSTGQWPEIMGANNTHVYFGIRTSNYGGTIYFEYGKPPFDGASGNWAGLASYAIPANTWHLYTVTYDGSTLTAYVDGAFRQQATSVQLDPTFGGMTFTTSGSGWVGSIDDARVYSRALSATEVQTLYNNYY